jgi:probable F420-dependent oxidoreductase
MPKIDLGPVGAVVSPADAGFVDTAVQLEQLGFSTIWLTGGPMASLAQIADVVRATATVRVASAIIAVDRFPAADVAALYRELERDHTGRFVVGLGGAHGADPLGTLNAYLDALDAVPPSARVMAALGPKMLELARDRAAGAFPVLITPEYAAQSRRIVGADTTLAVEQLVVLEGDPQRARAIARGPLSFLGSVPAYQSSFRRMGFSADDVASLSDALLDRLIVWGGIEPVVERVAALQQAGADHVAISVVSAAPSIHEWRRVAGALLPS